MATDVQPAAAAGATAEAAADRGAQHPSGGAGPARLSDDDHNLLFLLANIANDDPVEAKPGRRAARSRSEDDSSSGGSSDTQSKVPGGSAGRQQRLAQQRLRLRQQAAAAQQDDMEEDSDGGDASDSDGGGERQSDAAGPRGGPRARAAAAGAAAAAAAASEAAGDDDGPRAAKRVKPAKSLAPLGQRKYVSSQITIPILEAEGCFNMTQVDAARHLGFGSSTVLKKVMRRLGIKQWPYRKRTSAKKITHSLEEYMRKYGDPAKVEAVLERVRMELAVYEASPTGSIPLRPELAALRQRLYKLDNKVKHEFKRDAEAPLRQCVQSLVEKTWQELQPSWMDDLAQQPVAAALPPSSAENTPLGLPGLAALPVAAVGGGAAVEGGDSGAGGGGAGGTNGGVNDATLMLAMLLAQGIAMPAGFGAPAMPAPAAQQANTDAAAAAEAAAPLDPAQAEALARARVAALAPDSPLTAGLAAKEEAAKA